MFSSIDQFFWHANIAEGLENNILNINHDCGDCDDWLVQRGCLAILHDGEWMANGYGISIGIEWSMTELEWWW